MTYKSIPSSNIVDMSPSAIRSPKTFVMGGSLKTLTQLIKSLFSHQEQGFAYDPNDLTTLYQDAAGTIPVTAAGQPVGLMKDKSGRNNHASQTVSASRPILQRNATTGAYYLAFDGADDFLVTNSIDFTVTDEVSLFVGFKKLSDATTGVVAELSNTFANTGTYGVFAPNGASPTVGCGSKGTLASTRTFENIPSPFNAVFNMRSKISSDTLTVRLNSIQLSSIQDQGVGSFGNYPLYIGRRGGALLPFNGHIYSLIGIGRLTTDSETIALEKAIAKNTGVTLNV